MENHDTYEGACFCGAVRFTLAGAPVAMGYCHCESCRRWSAGPVNAFTLWKPESLRISQGADLVSEYQKTARSRRKYCSACGGHLYVDHPEWGLIDVYAAVIPDFPFAAGVHVNYRETVLPIHDGLPKFQDLPQEMGGSGVLMPEATGGRVGIPA